MTDPEKMRDALRHRYGEDFSIDPATQGLEMLSDIANRGSCRRFRADRIAPAQIELLAAVAFAAPTKSDLQQRDIILIQDPARRAALNALIAELSWIADAPELLVFCANNRRQRRLHALRGRDFANDHLDAPFNAVVDASVALACFVITAEAMGLGCCPISAIRNRAGEVSALLEMPEHVFPVAGLALGWPEMKKTKISLRLPTRVTFHRDRYAEQNLDQEIARYDDRRRAAQPYATQRFCEQFGEDQAYGWSEDKARQYSAPERATFGAYLRKQGFKLD